MIDKPQKTVYFLGAGASKASDFDLPTMANFFERADFTGVEYKNLMQFIKKRFPNQPLKNLNLEELVTTIELSLDKFGAVGGHPEPYIYEARTELNKYVTDKLRIDPQRECKTLEKIITSKMADNNSVHSIITLNYDLVIDALIRKKFDDPMSKLGRLYNLLGYDIRGSMSNVTYNAESPISYSIDREMGFYLKLHGSIDWVYCPNPACGNHQIFFPNQPGDMRSEPGELCTLCGVPIESVIVPPTMNKTFEKFPKMGFLWSLAYRQLKWAGKIVIFGVSFASSDYYLRWLFKKAIIDGENYPTIINIDTKPEVCDVIKEFTGVKPKHFLTLDEYLDKASNPQP